MSLTIEPKELWVWQGFFGSAARVAEFKAECDVDARVGVWIPLPGEPPMPVDLGGNLAMFAVQTRPTEVISCPPDIMEANPAMVGRMVGG